MGVRAGCPNLIERIEGGLLSYGNDMTIENNPFECGLGKYVNSTADHIGRAALTRIRAEGHTQEIRAIAIEGAPVQPCDRPWPLTIGGTLVGQVTSAAWSPDNDCNVAIGMVARAHWTPGTRMQVESADGPRDAVIREGFWK